MAKKIGTFRRKTRQKLSKGLRNKGKISISSYFQSFKEGDKVTLKAEPAVQGGMYRPRFHGNMGTVVGMQGKCYKVEISDKGKAKLLIVHPVHLKRMKV